ncbi:hypothetical protein L1787_13090 [Acuticoccus sp. M5D2P5]|uniref:hypothetical protein n=1 Tax=Acuticoccus kalidii TaxID=2910977 RepID=UPI001F2F62EF|nr:hypothetical protein [Acuticoccus kalidii]MCF3934345.1 hypothetical protein [Acuticoccus kalidii]
MAAKSFAAQVEDMVTRSKAKLEAVWKQSTQDVVDLIQTTANEGGRMPIDTGYLRASLQASLDDFPMVAREGPSLDQRYEKNAEEISLVIASADLGGKVMFGFVAAYAMRMEYGFEGTDELGRQYHQSGFGFVRGAVDEWQSIVTKNALKVKGLGAL